MSSVLEPHTDHDVPRSAADGPQLRTILLTDLVESTALVEQLGDGPAAELFREHDRLVVDLQQQWRGRLIDRSDGLLLLFERAIDGLGFALDYNRGLRAIGESRNITLQARTGLHVGEVLSWRNSDVAVSLGAKPLEVEGLAKPFAARLMTLARPGQILLSAVAEPLAHRAARELGERGEQLLWKSYGRWCFKGIPEAQEIYEVGEAGVAPLRAPKSTAKSWRDIPFWRRPAALGAELLLMAGLATGTWFLTRPQPAIAFGERDWVVVGDMRNLTGDKLLDDSLQQAFRISLEQSRFVNVLSDLKSRDTLALMQRKPGTALDRAIASEIALRDGARAVILPTVSEVGGRVRVSAEVIDPHTQTTVYAESADGSGAASTLDSIDTVTAALRGKLGEALESVEKNSAPLPQVSTGNLDALRAYALAVNALASTRNTEALRLFEHAIDLDPNFALAHIGIARSYLAADDPDHAAPHILAATSHAGRLTKRDALYAEAWAATLGPVMPMLDKWRLLSTLYPDYFASYQNYALWGWLYANQYKEGISGLKFAVASRQNPTRGVFFDTLAQLQIGMEQYQDAGKSVDASIGLNTEFAKTTKGVLLAVQRRYNEAYRTLSARRQNDLGTARSQAMLLSITLRVDEGNLEAATEQSKAALKFAEKTNDQLTLNYQVVALEIDALSGRNADVAAKAGALINRALTAASNANGLSKANAYFAVLTTGYVSARIGDKSGIDQALSIDPKEIDHLGYPNLARMYQTLRAAKERLAGNPERAIEILHSQLDGHELYQSRVVLLDAYRASNNTQEALIQAEWLATHRGRAYVEWSSYQLLQPLNIADSNLALLSAAECAKALGRDDAAQRYRKAFMGVRPMERLPDYLRRRVEVL